MFAECAEVTADTRAAGDPLGTVVTALEYFECCDQCTAHSDCLWFSYFEANTSDDNLCFLYDGVTAVDIESADQIGASIGWVSAASTFVCAFATADFWVHLHLDYSTTLFCKVSEIRVSTFARAFHVADIVVAVSDWSFSLAGSQQQVRLFEFLLQHADLLGDMYLMSREILFCKVSEIRVFLVRTRFSRQSILSKQFSIGSSIGSVSAASAFVRFAILIP